jgi:acetylornithine/N-succinyldiaminopimelate aminotransferase
MIKHLSSTEQNTVFERDDAVMFPVYKRLPILVSKATGCSIEGADGKTYLDMLGGIATNVLGHSHPRVLEAIRTQAEKYLHLSNVFYQEPQIQLAEMLKERTGYARVFFTNSGAESLEGALKLVKRWGNAQSTPKTQIIAFKGGFHGRTTGALSIMDKPLYKDGMGPFLPNTLVLPFNDCDALRAAVNESTCAVALEFLQGEGGITFASPEFVTTIAELREQYGFLLLADEVQAGMGRTGKFFCFEHFMVEPDVVMIAKGIGGGLPLGAILAQEHLAHVWDRGMHGTTFGGNPLSCVVGVIVMEELARGVMKNAKEVGCYLREKLFLLKEQFPAMILDVRGCGLMAGINLSEPSRPLVEKLLDYGIITNATADTVIRFVPPLILSKAEVDEFYQIMVQFFLDWSARTHSA